VLVLLGLLHQVVLGGGHLGAHGEKLLHFVIVLPCFRVLDLHFVPERVRLFLVRLHAMNLHHCAELTE